MMLQLEKKKQGNTLGFFITDAYLEMAKQKLDPKVDAAFMNSGGIRLPEMPAGAITQGKIFELMPFDNLMVLLKVKGSLLKQYLDTLAANEGVIESGITMQIDEMRNEQGSIYRSGSFTLRGAGVACDPGIDCNQLGRRLDEAPYFSGSDVQGTLTFSSTVPVVVFGIRWTRTGSSGGERLMAPVPVIDLSNGPNYGTQAVPLFAVGLGRTSELVLVNPTGSTLTGTVQFLDPYGVPVLVSLGSAYTWNASYSMAPNSSQKLVMADVVGGFGYGSVRVVPDAGSPVPSAFVNYNYVQDGLMTFEVAVPVTMGAAFRMPVEQSPNRQISTSLSIANPSSSGGNVWFSLTDSDGSFIASTSRYISDAGLASEIPGVLAPVANQEIEGVLRITTDLPGGISVAGYRARYNERQQLLYTTVVPALENGLPSSDARFFPYLLNGSGFTTDIILFSGKAGQSSAGSLRFTKPDGVPLDLGITAVPK